MSLDKQRTLELIQRSLGLKHKIKVQESMKAPESHDDLSHVLWAKWELEDELAAIELLLGEARAKNVAARKKVIGAEDASEAASRLQAKAKKKK